MWTAQVIEERATASLRYALRRGDAVVSYRQAIAAWQRDETFRHWFNALLAALPFRAFRWEAPGITSETADQPFELAALAGAELERSADPEAFAEHFLRNPSQEVLAFSNLGGDATLVVPAPRAIDRSTTATRRFA